MRGKRRIIYVTGTKKIWRAGWRRYCSLFVLSNLIRTKNIRVELGKNYNFDSECNEHVNRKPVKSSALFVFWHGRFSYSFKSSAMQGTHNVLHDICYNNLLLVSVGIVCWLRWIVVIAFKLKTTTVKSLFLFFLINFNEKKLNLVKRSNAVKNYDFRRNL